jgi:peptide/nickel transport system substrate-binding protein
VNRKLYALIAVVVLASMALAACGSAATAVPPTAAPQATAMPAPTATSAPKIVTLAYSQEPDNLGGYFTQMSYAIWVDQFITVSLFKWDNKENLVPELASEVPSAANGDLSADGLTITLKLKPNLKWSDGQPITSKDILYTWQANVDPKNAVLSRAGWSSITGIDTPDDTTAVVHFSALFPPWATLFAVGANTGSPLLPAHTLQGKEGLEKDPESHLPTVFSGPFMVKEWVAGDHMTLVPNPNYWQGSPKLSQINIKFVPDPETALAALKSGDVDLVPDLAASDLPTLQQMGTDTGGKVVSRTDGSGDFEHLFFNLGTTAGKTDSTGKVVGQSDVNGFCPLQDPNVRKAIALGIDRDTMIKTLLFGGAPAIATLWPNSYWNDTSLQPYPYDPTTAASLLDAAGYKVGADGIRAGTCGGKPVKFSIGIETTTKQIRKDYVLAIQANLKQIGIEIKPNHQPAGTFFGSYTAGADMPKGNFDMAIYTTGFYPDPYTDGFLCASVPNKANQAGDNNYHYCDPAFDALWAQANSTLDAATRQKAFIAIQEYMYNNYLVIPLYGRPNVYGLSSRFVPGPGGANGGFNWDAFDWDVTQ